MNEKKKPEKLTYDEARRYADTSSTEEHRRHNDYNFSITCSCGETFPVPLDVLGNTAACPKCGKLVKIPEEKFLPITCSCGKSLRIPRQTASGKKCPQCKKPIKLLEMPAEQVQPEASAVEKAEQSTSAKKAGSKSEQPSERMKTVFIDVCCSCGKKLVLPLSLVNKPIKCPQCQNVFKLPEKNFIHMNCSCGMELKVLRILEGNYGKCPSCGKTLKITENKV